MCKVCIPCTCVVQPDRGAICFYWVAALTCAIDAVSRSDQPSRLVCARWLLAYIVMYTGAAIPERVRPRLASAVKRGLGETDVESSLTTMFIALAVAIRSDALLSPRALPRVLC